MGLRQFLSFFPFFFWDNFLRSLRAASRFFGRPSSSKRRPSGRWTWGNALHASFPCPLSVSAQVSPLRRPLLPLLCSSSGFLWGLTASATPLVLVSVSPIKLTHPGSQAVSSSDLCQSGKLNSGSGETGTNTVLSSQRELEFALKSWPNS